MSIGISNLYGSINNFFESGVVANGKLLGATQKLGIGLNNATYKVANNVGKKLLDKAAAGSPGIIGSLMAKSPLFEKVASGLSKLGTTAGGKIPGISVLMTLGVGLWGVGVAASRAIQGDWSGAGHQLIKSAGSVAGFAAGAALCAIPGIGFVAGLALACGLGFTLDYAGQKIADAVFPSVAQRENQEAQNNQQQGTQTTGQNLDVTDINNLTSNTPVTSMNDKQFDTYINDFLKEPYMF